MRTLLTAAALVLVLGAAPAGAAAPISEPAIATLAGSGAAGSRDGSLAQAEFLAPVAVAVGGNAVYVADMGANTIREIVDGRVETIAGSPRGAAGYADGPAAAALFNRSCGVAVGSDGTVFVADSQNRRIRAIRHGVVSTLAGSGAESKADGVGTAAGFTFPKAVAVDADGNVYVADYHVGLRKISTAGVVVTQAVPTTGLVYDVAVRFGGSAVVVAYTDDQGLHLISEGTHRALEFTAEREPYSQENRVGHAFGVAVVDRDSVIVTDLWTNAVRYVNFPDPPFRPAPKTRTLAGGIREGSLVIGASTDGTPASAGVDVPYGVAVADDGRILIADTGGRRIRRITGLNTRLPIRSDLSNLSFPPHTYRIAIIGDSLLWNDILWPESIGGILENGLNAAPASAHAAVRVLSASGGTLQSATDFITTNLGDGEADLVILAYDRPALDHDFALTPTLRADWKTTVPDRIRALALQLARQGTKFALLPISESFEISPAERAMAREESLDYTNAYDPRAAFAAASDFETAMQHTGQHVVPMLAPLTQRERAIDAPPLFNTRDDHLTIQGSIAVGDLLLADMLTWKPWAAAMHVAK